MSESLVVTSVPERLADVLGAVQVDVAGLRSVVDGKVVEAESRAALEVALSSELYGQFHARAGTEELVRTSRDWLLEQELIDAVPHQNVLRKAVLLSYEGGEDDHALVLVDGVRVMVSRERLRDVSHEVVSGSSVKICVPSAWPASSPGFVYAYGSKHESGRAVPVLRIYVSMDDAADAVVVWPSVLSALEAQSVPYTAKVLSRRDDYPRADAIVVYLQGPSAEQVHRLVDRLATLPRRGTATSVFAEPLVPGITMAEEPIDDRPRMRGLSFGQHRALVMARALMRSAAERQDIGTVLAHEFAAARIQLERPGMNTPGSHGGPHL